MGIWLMTSLAPACFSALAAASSDVELAPSETAQTVWAAQGMNLRDGPSASGRIVKKLVYGTPVSVLPQSDKPVAYEMEFFPKITRPASDGKPRAQVLLDGEWIRIKAGDQQGYVFNKLLLPFPPIKADEDTEHYLARIFELTARPAVNHGGAIDTEYVSHGPRKIQLVRHESSEASAIGGEVFIPDMSFDEAFVFFNAVLPPTLDADFSYQKGALFEYQYQAPGGARLTMEKGGVRFYWQDEE
jgi:hypothetical protein